MRNSRARGGKDRRRESRQSRQSRQPRRYWLGGLLLGGAAIGLPAAYALTAAAARPHLVRGLALIAPEGLEPFAVGRHPPRRPLQWSGETLLRRLSALPLVGATALDLLTSREALLQHLRG